MFLWISVHYFNWYLLMGTQIQFPHPPPPPAPVSYVLVPSKVLVYL